MSIKIKPIASFLFFQIDLLSKSAVVALNFVYRCRIFIANGRIVMFLNGDENYETHAFACERARVRQKQKP
jgi:hypothetical protein